MNWFDEYSQINNRDLRNMPYYDTMPSGQNMGEQMMGDSNPMSMPGQMMDGSDPMFMPGQMMGGSEWLLFMPGQMMGGSNPMYMPGQMMGNFQSYVYAWSNDGWL